MPVMRIFLGRLTLFDRFAPVATRDSSFSRAEIFSPSPCPLASAINDDRPFLSILLHILYTNAYTT